MDIPLYVEILIFVFLIFCSAFFSGSETAFFSLSELFLKKLKEKDNKNAVRVKKLMEHPRRLLITILVGNTIVNVVTASFAAFVAIDLILKFGFNERWTIFIEVVIVTLFILVLGEITPKVIAVKNAKVFAEYVSILFIPISFVLKPFVLLLTWFTDKIVGFVGVYRKEGYFSEDELRTLLDIGEERGTLEADEKEMIHSIFEFSETAVREVMIPRIDMAAMDINTSLPDLIAYIREKGHSRIPVYENSVDNIIGILYAKDLLRFVVKDKDQRVNLKSILRKPFFVPESKMIDDLLREFQLERNHMAIVVDEYGGTAGLVTLEDIIEEIVGEIQDEYDEEIPNYQQMNDVTFSVNARMSISDLNEQLGFKFPEDESYDSLGGFIYYLFGHVPEEGEKVEYQNYHFTVEKVEGQSIQHICIEIFEPIKDQEHDGKE